METFNDFQSYNKDMFKLSNSLRSKLDRQIDERILIETYEEYERAFNNFDKINNQKQLEEMLKGASKYITALQNLFNKELNDSEL
jgi:hypothetical protein